MCINYKPFLYKFYHYFQHLLTAPTIFCSFIWRQFRVLGFVSLCQVKHTRCRHGIHCYIRIGKPLVLVVWVHFVLMFNPPTSSIIFFRLVVRVWNVVFVLIINYECEMKQSGLFPTRIRTNNITSNTKFESKIIFLRIQGRRFIQTSLTATICSQDQPIPKIFLTWQNGKNKTNCEDNRFNWHL